MANIFERGILLAIGAAAVAREAADSLTQELIKRGEATAQEGRETLEEAVDQAKGEARNIRFKLDSTVRKGYRDMGIATSDELAEMQLKIAQLEHRIALLESAWETVAGREDEPAGTAAAAGGGEASRSREG